MERSKSKLWAERVAEWKRSGQTAREFGKDIGIDPKALHNWKYRLDKARREESDTSSEASTVFGDHEVQEKGDGLERCEEIASGIRPGAPTNKAARSKSAQRPVRFVELGPPEPGPTESGFDVRLRCGHEIRVPAQFNPSSLQKLLCILDGRS